MPNKNLTVLIRAMRIHVAMATSLLLCRRKVTLDVSILSFRLINLSAAGWGRESIGSEARKDINCRNAQTTPADSRVKQLGAGQSSGPGIGEEGRHTQTHTGYVS